MGTDDSDIQILTLASTQRKHAFGKSYLESSNSGSLPNLIPQGLKPKSDTRNGNNNILKLSARIHDGGRVSTTPVSKSPMNSRRSFPDHTKKHKPETVRRFLSVEAISDRHSSCPDLSTKGLVSLDSNVPRNRRVQRHTESKAIPSPPAPSTPQGSPSLTPKNVRRRHFVGIKEQSTLLSRSLNSNTFMKRGSDLVGEDLLSLSFPGTSWTDTHRTKSGNFHIIYSEDTNRTNEQAGKSGKINLINLNEVNSDRDDCGQQDIENGDCCNEEEVEGDTVDPELADKCRLWLKGVEAAKGERNLEDVTRADISWR